MDSDDTSVPLGYARDIFDLTGRVAVITGGGSGLGRAIAIGYAQCGVTVVVADIDEAGAAETVATVDEQGGRAAAMPLDVTKRSQCVEVADAVRREHGRIDILVNSAGAAHRSPAETFPEERFDHIIELNLKGTYLCCQAFGAVMLEQGKGSIVNMASIGSFIAYPLSSAYIASKGGVAQVTKVLALGVAGAGCPRQRHRTDADGIPDDPQGGPDHVAHRRFHQGPHGPAPARPAAGADRGRDIPRERRVGAGDRPHHHVRRRLPDRVAAGQYSVGAVHMISGGLCSLPTLQIFSSCPDSDPVISLSKAHPSPCQTPGWPGHPRT